jgi:transposase-like protein
VWIVTAGSLLALGLITALALFATAWHQQTAKKQAAEASLSATRSQLATTQGLLRQSQALLARQQTILKQTATVLRKVDPLLSGADQLQHVTAEIQSARDTFATDSSQMTANLVYLANVLIDPVSYPGVDTSSLGDQVNAELDTVRSDLTTLALYDGNYSDASTAFGNTASALTKAVRQLQTELKAVSKP